MTDASRYPSTADGVVDAAPSPAAACRRPRRVRRGPDGGVLTVRLRRRDPGRPRTSCSPSTRRPWRRRERPRTRPRSMPIDGLDATRAEGQEALDVAADDVGPVIERHSRPRSTQPRSARRTCGAAVESGDPAAVTEAMGDVQLAVNAIDTFMAAPGTRFECGEPPHPPPRGSRPDGSARRRRPSTTASPSHRHATPSPRPTPSVSPTPTPTPTPSPTPTATPNSDANPEPDATADTSPTPPPESNANRNAEPEPYEPSPSPTPRHRQCRPTEPRRRSRRRPRAVSPATRVPARSRGWLLAVLGIAGAEPPSVWYAESELEPTTSADDDRRRQPLPPEDQPPGGPPPPPRHLPGLTVR